MFSLAKRGLSAAHRGLSFLKLRPKALFSLAKSRAFFCQMANPFFFRLRRKGEMALVFVFFNKKNKHKRTMEAIRVRIGIFFFCYLCIKYP